MKLAILGGGGFRVPLVYRALLGDAHERRVDHVHLYDVNEHRLTAIRRVLEEQARAGGTPVRIAAGTSLRDALRDADFVFSAIRVGGLEGRTCDERVALDLGVLGQETVGPGGVAYGLRTIPVAREIAQTVAEVAPRAWFINFTNPAGMITQAMQEILGDKVVGICDSPIGLARRAAGTLSLTLDDASGPDVEPGYLGLNHLGWLTRLTVNGEDRLPEVFAAPERLARTEEGRLFGVDWLTELQAIPNEYLYYYYFTREAVAAIRGGAETRGEYLLRQQDSFYAAVRADSAGSALEQWERTRREREETYMKEAREEGEEREESDLVGGYEGVALSLMAAVARDEPARLILNVRNGTTVPQLPGDAVIETWCDVDAAGIRPRPAPPLATHMLGLMQQVKAVDELAIAAATHRSRRTAHAALALHPLVDSATTATALLEGYLSRIPSLATVFEPRGA